jgi:hypothetical protein
LQHVNSTRRIDNIPLTALALKQGGYDWGYLAYSVGLGGSMLWFGSSAGVALSNMYPEAKSVGLWLRHGWYIAAAYVIGFFLMLAVLGWSPDADHRKRADLETGKSSTAVTFAMLTTPADDKRGSKLRNKIRDGSELRVETKSGYPAQQ